MFKTLCSIDHLLSSWDSIKSKNAAGGIDGESIAEFDKDLRDNLQELSEELSTGKWIPHPYLKIEIPKNKNEKRRLGLLTVRDKVVQQAIRMLIEPKLENLFLNNSYGYRPGKGAVKAIKRVLQERQKKSIQWAIKLDIDNYFDNIDHGILEARIKAVITDAEIVRLIMLCVKMGVVSKGVKWEDVEKGIPQGAVLSPLLANLYLHSMDQHITSRTTAYVRYADDFIILTETEELARTICTDTGNYLKEKLKLPLNEPAITRLSEGVKFLGITIKKDSFGISEEKRSEILEKISSLNISSRGLDRSSAKKWSGIIAYYGQLLPEPELRTIDTAFLSFLQKTVSDDWNKFPSRSALRKTLDEFHFLSADFRLREKDIKITLLQSYASAKRDNSGESIQLSNKKLILKRKREYQLKEAQNSELIITKPGVTVGLTQKGITVKTKGKVISSFPSSNMKHIIILSDGVGLSSNLLRHTLKHKIPVDFFNYDGTHLGSFLSASSFQCRLWQQQSEAGNIKRNHLAGKLIEGKLSNQLNLIKYFHKYHKQSLPELQTHLDGLESTVDELRATLKSGAPEMPDFIPAITAYEANGAAKYWECVRCLLSNDDVEFEKRIHPHATDLVNCLLNYGYAILYTRCWQALLAAQLNPYDSVIHARQPGQPTFAFDFIEIFRAQAVDRVVISLIQKNEPLSITDGKLSKESKALLIRNISERLYKPEKFRKENMNLAKIIKIQASEIAGYFNNDGNKFRPYKAKW